MTVDVEVEQEVATEVVEVSPVEELLGARYTIGAELGRGAFGVTYAGTRRTDGMAVAIKSMDVSTVSDWKTVELFEREAKVLRALNHPGIPRYVEHSAPTEKRPDARFVLVQELADGVSLAQKLAGGWRPTEAQAERIGRQLLDICAYLHDLEPPVVHRDIKPANVIVDTGADGQLTVRLVDFGAVKERIASETRIESTVVGTYGYMAPEQFQGRSQPASDLYGIGATLVHLVTGIAPADIPQKRLKLDWEPRANVSKGFARWVNALIEPAPEDRFASARSAYEAPLTDAAPVSASEPPVHSKIRATHYKDTLTIHFPAGSGKASVPALAFSTVWLGFVGFWTASAISMGASLLFPLFSIPFWIVGIGMFRKELAKINRGTLLSIGPEHFVFATKRGLGTKRRTGKTKDLVANNDVSYQKPRPFVLSEGARAHTISDDISAAERTWLDALINEHVARHK